MATMEVDSAAKEELFYANLAETRSLKPSAYPDRNTNNRYVAKLDGRQKKLGPSILLKVMAGDKISFQAKSWYKTNGKPNSSSKMSLAEQAVSLAGSNGAGAIAHSERLGPGFSGNALLPALMSILKSRQDNQLPSAKPRAYINWILLDEDLKPIREDSSKAGLRHSEHSGFQQVGEEEEEIKQHIKENWIADKSGYVYIFTSNESETADVIFEDFGVQSIQGPLLEVNHTYPFGLTMAGISSQAPGKLENKFQFNGNEKQCSEFSDGSGLDLLDFGFRGYMPSIGRFLQQDALTSVTPGWGQYTFTQNNPILFNDPLGLDTIRTNQPLLTPGFGSTPNQLADVTVSNKDRAATPANGGFYWPTYKKNQKEWSGKMFARIRDNEPLVQKGDPSWLKEQIPYHINRFKAEQEGRQEQITAVGVLLSPIIIAIAPELVAATTTLSGEISAAYAEGSLIVHAQTNLVLNSIKNKVLSRVIAGAVSVLGKDALYDKTLWKLSGSMNNPTNFKLENIGKAVDVIIKKFHL